jgi:endonuclease/exonuclease/phosphatase family metal-dependent hydrolase
MKYPPLPAAVLAVLLAACSRPTAEPAASAPAEAAREFTVVTYNVEHLFDVDGIAVYDDLIETDDENTYSPGHLLRKMQAIAETLKTFNDGAGPEVVAFNEFEIDFTPETTVTDYDAFLEKYRETTAEAMLTTGLSDEIRGLPAEALLLKHLEDEGLTGYRVAIGADAPETAEGVRRRAHKNALFSKFPVTEVRSHPTAEARDILETTLDVEGHPFRIFVNHWKSGASSTESEAARLENARTLRQRVEEILASDPAADILLAGDFNSQYNQSQAYPFMKETGVNDILGSGGDELATATATNYSLYNLWYELPPEERKSDHFRGNWGTLMQKMITPGLYDHHGVQYVDNSFAVVILDGINAHTPLRIPKRWSNTAGGSGASDHFPIAARFRVVEDADKERRQELVGPGRDDGAAEPLTVGFESLRPSSVPEFTAAMAGDPGPHDGGIFLVRGRVSVVNPQTLDVHGHPFLLWSRDLELRKHMQRYPEGAQVELIGELGMHRGRWQFIVTHRNWLVQEPRPTGEAG